VDRGPILVTEQTILQGFFLFLHIKLVLFQTFYSVDCVYAGAGQSAQCLKFNPAKHLRTYLLFSSPFQRDLE